MTPDADDVAGSVRRWLTAEADECGVASEPVTALERLVFDQGVVVGAEFVTEDGTLTVRARHGVLLNTLAPGLVDTDRNAGRKQADPDGWEAYVRDLNWMGRAGDPSEMVGAAIFLASNACSFMTGETVVLSGGY